MTQLVPCKTCKVNIDKSAKTCPHCGVKDPGASAGDTAKGCLLMIVVIVVISFLMKACEEEKTPEQLKAEAAAKIERDCKDKAMAMVMSETFVKRKLKSPATAEFPSYVADGVSIKYLGDCTNQVIAYVDSQNGFGAMIRSPYLAKLKYNPETETYTILDLIIE